MSDQYQVSARKYRPKSFDAVVGQDHIVSTLKNTIKQQSIAHAYLFSGIRGVGKTTCARIFAQAINCENARTNEGEPCGTCPSCQSYAEQSNFNIIELDAASNNSVENIREWISEARVPPIRGKYKVYILDEAHMLSTQAFNAFLKTLEEPPAHAIFILATTEKNKLLPTIISRCQLMDFASVAPVKIEDALEKICQKESITYDPEVLFLIAEKADGSLRDALSIFDKVVAFSDKNLHIADVQRLLQVLDDHFFLKNVDCFLKKDTASCLLLFDHICRDGGSPHEVLGGFGKCFRNLLVAKEDKTRTLLNVYPSLQKTYTELANKLSFDFIISALSIIHQALNTIRFAENKRYFVEFVLIELSQLIDAVQWTSATEDAPAKPLAHALAMPIRVRKKRRHLAEYGATRAAMSSTPQHALYVESPTSTPKKDEKPATEIEEIPVEKILPKHSKKSVLELLRERSEEKIKSRRKLTELLSDEQLLEVMERFIQRVSLPKEVSADEVARIGRDAKLYMKDSLQKVFIEFQSPMDKYFFDEHMRHPFHDFIIEHYGYEVSLHSELNPLVDIAPQTETSSKEAVMNRLQVSHPYLYEFIKKINAEITLSSR